MERYNKSTLQRVIDLENKVDKLILSGVVGQSEQLNCKTCNIDLEKANGFCPVYDKCKDGKPI